MAFAVAPPDLPLVFDTSTFDPWRRAKPQIVRRVTEYIGIHQQPPVLTSMTVFEVLHGFENKAHRNAGLSETDERDLGRTHDLIDFVDTILPFDHIAAAIAAYIYPRFR